MKGEKIKKSETEKKKNQEREIQSLFMREKKVKRVMLARQPTYLLMHHDYCLSSISISFLVLFCFISEYCCGGGEFVEFSSIWFGLS